MVAHARDRIFSGESRAARGATGVLMQRERITIAVLALGGQGGGVFADWLVAVAERNGYFAQATSVPGVAQRTGSTIYYIELYPEENLAGRQPVLALMPAPSDVDVVVAAELMEAGRAILRGLGDAGTNRADRFDTSYLCNLREICDLGWGRRQFKGDGSRREEHEIAYRFRYGGDG